MHFPSERLVLPKALFKRGNKVNWFDKDNNQHKGVVLDVQFGTLATGWFYLVKLDEPVMINDREITNIKARDGRLQKQ